MLQLFHRFDGPRAIADLVAGSDTDVLTKLDGKPALLHLPGTLSGTPARLIATLLHGNEDSGFRALCRWLRTAPVVRQPLWMFIGNTRAASQNGWFADRYLDDQEDFNRVWGIYPATTRMRLCAQQVFEIITASPLEAAIDIHNNTGDNPLYCIVPDPNPASYALAAALAEIGLLWGTQQHTLMQALEPVCPAVAVECGMAGVPAHVDVAVGVIKTFLAAPHFGGDLPARMLEVRQRVEVRREVVFDFARELTDDLDLVVMPGLDAANFERLPAGTVLGRTVPGSDIPFEVIDVDGRDTTADFLHIDAAGKVALIQDVIPAMMTRTPEQTRRDCLFYILEHH
ncbi:MAG TPA: hypothetical protein VMM13_00580 [Euzebya sp.]|nr:hypothetical protein [Euzebya sp.]